MTVQLAPDPWYVLQEAIDARQAATDTHEFVGAWARERHLRQLEERNVSTKERADLEKKGQAMPGGRYPIKHGGDLDAAIQAFGRGNPPDKSAIKAHIVKCAKKLGLAHKLPAGWTADSGG
jgi:hypothetical protein